MQDFDCVVCGSCVVDLLVRPFPLEAALGRSRTIVVEPIEATVGGLVANAGVAMARLGLRVAAVGMVGDDAFGAMFRQRLECEGIWTEGLKATSAVPTTTAVVLIDRQGERSFAFHPGATAAVDRRLLLDHLELFARSHWALLGYYSLLPRLEGDLPEVLQKIRRTGCRTALDSAGDGGHLEPLLQGQAAFQAVRQAQFDEDRVVRAHLRPHSPGHLPQEAHAPLEVPTPGILAAVHQGREELVDQVPVGRVDLDGVKAGFSGPSGGFSEGLYDGPDLVLRHRPGRARQEGEVHCGGGKGLLHRLGAAAHVTLVDLGSHSAPFSVDEVREAPQVGDEVVGVDAGHLRVDAPSRMDEQVPRHEKPHPAAGQVPVHLRQAWPGAPVGQAQPLGRGRADQAVGQSEGSDACWREEKAHSTTPRRRLPRLAKAV